VTVKTDVAVALQDELKQTNPDPQRLALLQEAQRLIDNRLTGKELEQLSNYEKTLERILNSGAIKDPTAANQLWAESML